MFFFGCQQSAFSLGAKIRIIVKETGLQVVKKLMDVIVYGTITKTIPAKQTVHLQKDGFEAVISQNWNGDKVNWLLTGWKQIKTPTVSNP